MINKPYPFISLYPAGDFFPIPLGMHIPKSQVAQVQWAEWGTGWTSAFVGARPVKAGLRVKIGSGGSHRFIDRVSLIVNYSIGFNHKYVILVFVRSSILTTTLLVFNSYFDSEGLLWSNARSGVDPTT